MVREELGVGGERLAEHLDDEVQVSQVLTHLGHERFHQVVVGLRLGRRWLLVHEGEAADVLLVLMEHVHQHLRAGRRR